MSPRANVISFSKALRWTGFMAAPSARRYIPSHEHRRGHRSWWRVQSLFSVRRSLSFARIAKPLLRGVTSAAAAAPARRLAGALGAADATPRRFVCAPTRRLLAPTLLLDLVRHSVSPVSSAPSCVL